MAQSFRKTVLLVTSFLLLVAAALVYAQAPKETPQQRIKVFPITAVSVQARDTSGVGIDTSKFLNDSLLEKWGVRKGYRLQSIVVVAPATTPSGTATVWVVFEKE